MKSADKGHFWLGRVGLRALDKEDVIDFANSSSYMLDSRSFLDWRGQKKRRAKKKGNVNEPLYLIISFSAIYILILYSSGSYLNVRYLCAKFN